MMIKTYINAYVKIQKNEDILSIMSNLQPNCSLKSISKRWTHMQETSGLSTRECMAIINDMIVFVINFSGCVNNYENLVLTNYSDLA